jgi:hypothetical protein
MQASANTGIPARLLKNVFSRESQIWPGIYRTYRETGLGQMTENGADTVLLWNPVLLPPVLPAGSQPRNLRLGYGNLDKPAPEFAARRAGPQSGCLLPQLPRQYRPEPGQHQC